MIRYAILGSIGLCSQEGRVAVGGPRQTALLALLLVNANRAVSRDRLIDLLWGDQAVGTALKRLQMAIARLRRTLDPDGAQGESALQTVTGGYLLKVRPGELDADVFQTRVEDARRALHAGDAAGARTMLREAAEMWHGPALADVSYEEFAQPEIRRLEEVRLAALESRVECELRLGEHDSLIAELEALVVAHPARERLTAQLMLALYRCGRQGDALEAYARARAYLTTELGLEPGPALQTLQTEILAQSPTLQRGGDESGDGSAVTHERVMLPIPHALQTAAGSVFAGREAELGLLRQNWALMTRGQRVAALVSGEAGIGKTRLAAEFARALHQDGALVLYGRCDEGLAVPYQPFVEALRPYARAAGRARLHAELADLTSELGRLLPELGGLRNPLPTDPETERFALFEATAALIAAMAREQPTLIVLDDLHWATNPTLLLLRHLIRSERRLGALLLCTYRETEVDLGQPLAQFLADLHRDAGVQSVSIRGLTEPAMRALLEAAVGRVLHEPEPLLRVLATQTAGNPFFMRELLADIAESGAISVEDEGLDLEVLAARLAIPEGLRHVIGQRVARLTAPAGRALRVAAVAGTTFSFALLERVLGEESGVLDALDEAVAAGLLVEADRGDYAFAHALVRQTIYDQLSTARRMRLHRQLGKALETLGDVEAHIETLAHHFAQAAADGQAVKAADYALAAGRAATARLGYEEAIAHHQRGLGALPLSRWPHEDRRCALLLALGEAWWGAGDLTKARQAYAQAADVAEMLEDPIALAHAALGFSGPLRFDTAVTPSIADVLQRAVARFDSDDSALRARLTGRLAAALVYTGNADRTRMLACEALEMARRLGDNATLADVLASTLWAIRGPDTLDQSVALARELARVAEAVGDATLVALARVRLLDLLLELGDIVAMHREFESLQRLADTRRERYFSWFVDVYGAGQALLCGRLDESEACARKAAAQRFEGHDAAAAYTFAMQMVFVRREQGRRDELADAVANSGEQYPDQLRLCVLAYLYAHLQREAQARQHLEALARADFCDLPRNAYWLPNLSMLCEVVVLLDDAQRAQLLYTLLLPYAHRCVAVGLMCYGPVSRDLGLLSTTLSRYNDAEPHFERALTTSAQIRSPLWMAHTKHDYANMLRLRNQPGDSDKALELLAQALATAQKLGLKAIADKAQLLKQAAETAAPGNAHPEQAESSDPSRASTG